MVLHIIYCCECMYEGGVLVPFIFNVYFNEMSHKLDKSGICKIGIHYICALAYADDVILLWSSSYGL